MQIVPGNALAQSVSGSAGVSRAEPHAQAAAHGKAQAAGAARPGQAAPGGDVALAQSSNQRANHVERPIPSGPQSNAAPGSVLDIRV